MSHLACVVFERLGWALVKLVQITHAVVPSVGRNIVELKKGHLYVSHVRYNCPLFSPWIQPYFSAKEASSILHQSSNCRSLIVSNFEGDDSAWIEDVFAGDKARDSVIKFQA